ncbi:MAG: nucleotidyltransferase domain-containing protein [bacterium]|jgi:predicted nucleotidyltransferase|nr:nucleotidyltransferase domain-containing protein [bacterium]
MRFGLKNETIKKISAVFSRYPQVEKAVLYGSRAKGNYKNGSDIDLTLHGTVDLTTIVLYKIMEEIDDLLLPYTIDLSIFRSISDADVIDHIQRVGVVFYARDEAYVTGSGKDCG